MGSSAPPAPNPDPNIGRAALRQAELGENYLKFAKEQFAVSAEMQQEMNDISKEVSTHFLDVARQDRERYETEFKPLEDEFLAIAKDAGSPEQQAQAAAEARADVQTAAASERGTMERRSSSMGINPASGRFQGQERALGLGTALASAGAQNEARGRARDKGIALKGAAIDMGKGLPAASGIGMSQGLNAAQQPFNAHLASQGIMQGGTSTAMKGQAGMANTLNQQHQNEIGIWNSQMQNQQANSAGFGQALGTAAGIGLSFLSSKKAKKNRKPVEEGAALGAVEQMPVESYDYKPGQGDGGSHVGPMAEDFAKATGQGDGSSIAVQDALGVTMGAVKDLSAKVNRMAEAIGLGGVRRPATAQG